MSTVSEAELLRPVDRFLISVLPDGCRDGIAGDLIEEARMIAADGAGVKEGRRWIRAQLIKSLPGVVSLHFRQKEDDGMKHAKWFAAVVVVALGALQAWDSGVLDAPAGIGALVAIAIAVGVAAIFIEHEGIRFGVALLVLGLLFLARAISPVNLPELGLAGLPIFLVLVFGPRFMKLRQQQQGPRGPGAAA